MVLAPPACHAPFTPAPQFSKQFANRTAPRTKAFNRNPSKDPPKHWLLRTKPAKMSDKVGIGRTHYKQFDSHIK